MENVQKFKLTLAQKAGVVAATGYMALAGSSANAADFTLDTSSVVTTITGGVAVVSSIGLAVLSLIVVVKLFKWARSAL